MNEPILSYERKTMKTNDITQTPWVFFFTEVSQRHVPQAHCLKDMDSFTVIDARGLNDCLKHT